MEWQKIETAPHNGEDVLLFFPSEASWDLHMRTGWWLIGEGKWYCDEAASHSMDELYGEPSHWMPLPKAPE